MPNVVADALPVSTGRLAVQTCPHAGRPGLIVTGELDISTAGQLRRAVREVSARASSDSQAFLLDLGGLTFLDTAGVSVLHDIQNAVVDRGWALRFALPTASGPQRVLDIAHREGWLCPPWGAGPPQGRRTSTRKSATRG